MSRSALRVRLGYVWHISFAHIPLTGRCGLSVYLGKRIKNFGDGLSYRISSQCDEKKESKSAFKWVWVEVLAKKSKSLVI